MEAFQNLFHTHHVACKTVALGVDDFLEFHLVIGCIRHALAYVAGPSAGTARTSGGTKGNGVFAAQYADAFQALLSDDVAGKDVVVFLDILAHVGDEFLYPVHKVGMDIGLYTANGVIVQDEASATGFLENVEHLFAVAEAIQEGGSGAQVLAEAREEQNVRVDALQLVHDGTDVLHAFAHFHAHGLFDAHAQRMAVLHGTQVIQTVGQGQRLRVSEAFVHLLDAAMDVAAVHVNLVDGFSFERHAETEHAVCGRVLGADVYHIFVFAKQLGFLFQGVSVFFQLYFVGGIRSLFIRHAQWVLLLGFIVLTERETDPIVAQEQTTHVWVSYEDDAEEIVYFPFWQVGSFPDAAY